MFQSLNRAYKRSDGTSMIGQGEWKGSFNPSIGLTSVPTERPSMSPSPASSSFNPSIGLTSVPTYTSASASILFSMVSIPQSGLQAFRQSKICAHSINMLSFQSLNRAYKRSDQDYDHSNQHRSYSVSIPQSGLQAFRRYDRVLHLLAYRWFQSLNRAYKRSDSHPL